MTVRVTVPLDRAERSALMKLAEYQKRDERQQAAYIIRQALESAGLLQPAQKLEVSHNER